LPFSGPISGYTGSKDAIDRAYSWLKICVSEHGCRGPVHARLPTRILRIEGHKKVRLQISDGQIGSYACLSHCWGDRLYAPLKTTSATLDAFLAEVPWKDLPRTFRHAITFCFRLGISYLWIDSLCILQDSDDDWRHEGSKMADIYESALLTLAATKAANPTEGCFSVAHDRYKSRYMSFPTEGLSTSNTTVQVRDILPHGEQGHDLKLPLFRRAWTFQERKLSPRVIHFTEHELGWECGKGTWCECLSPFRLFEREQQLGKTTLDASSSRLTWQIEWHRIVSEYTGKNLTYPRDIFPALQGLAQRYSPVMGPYLAGLWDTTLIYSLTWFRTNRPKPLNPVPSGPLEEWRAPTWSWAAVDGKVRFSKIGIEAPRIFASVESAMIVSKSNDPTGEVSAGILRLKGKSLIGRL
ncbi:heterokaryon incompatibility protein-domain-containing protein, partial [Paraphoma chrysanthemicola]